ncbi:MAG: hypothetical protein EHM33_01920 [Chloroflexi bacterium]|nr:MAG: hypothetical protein EHM33_01920 [Chloroflexota bacterium]
MPKLQDQYKSTIHQLVRKVLNLEKWRRDVTGDSPLFDIANEHTPTTLTTSQNNYDPGYYDVLRVNATANISITGITKGKKGRFLEFYNVSDFKITFPNESASSTAANRIINSSGQNIVVFPTGRVRMYYDSTLSRWIIPDPPSWTGAKGISMYTYKGDGSQTIPHNTVTDLVFDTVDSGDNEWGIYNTATNLATIPAGLGGIWVGQVQGYWFFPSVAGVELQIGIAVNGAALSGRGLGMPSVLLEAQHHAISFVTPLDAGDTIKILIFQKTGVDLDYKVPSFYLALAR